MTGEDVWILVWGGFFAQLTDRLPNPILLDTFRYYTVSIQYTENVMVFIHLFVFSMIGTTASVLPKTDGGNSLRKKYTMKTSAAATTC